MHLQLTLSALFVAATANGQGFSWRHTTTHVLGDCHLVFDGGRDLLVAYNGELAEWDGRHWIRRDTLHHPPAAASSRLVYDGNRRRVVLVNNAASLGNLEVFEFDGNDWQQKLPAGGLRPPARTLTAAAYDPVRQMVVIAGGTGSFGPLADTWGWNGTAWTQLTASGPASRGTCAMAFHPPTSRLVLHGGEVRGNETWTFDGQQWRQENPTTSPPAFTQHRMTTDPNLGLVWLHDGASGDTWSWDGSNWTHGPTGPTARAKFGFAADADGCVVAGGELNRLGNGFASDNPAGDTWRLRLAQWTKVGDGGPAQLADCVASYDERRGRLVVLDHAINVETQTWEWDGHDWFDTDETMNPFVGIAMCYDPFRGRTLAFGGIRVAGVPLPVASDELRSWDGTRWTTVQTSTTPPGRSFAAMAFDPLRGEVVMHGGNLGFLRLEDTWIWNGISWRQAASIGPAGRVGHAMTYDAQLGGLLMFGGIAGTSVTSDTWLWNGLAWQRLQPATLPPPRSGHQLVSSAEAPVPTLLGGARIDGTRLADRWQWIAGDWQRLPEDLPAVRAGNRVATTAIDNHGDTLFVAAGSTWLGGENRAITAELGPGCVGTTALSLQAIGDPALGNAGFSIAIGRAAPGVPYVVGAGLGIGGRSIGNCTLYLPSVDVAVGGLTSSSGAATARLPVPEEAALLGLLFSMQASAPAPSEPIGFVLSEGRYGRIGR